MKAKLDALFTSSVAKGIAKWNATPAPVTLKAVAADPIDAALNRLEETAGYDDVQNWIESQKVRRLWREADVSTLSESTLERLEKADIIEPFRPHALYVAPIVKATCRGFEHYDGPNPTTRILGLIQTGRF